jgi:hypothetical protein
VPPRMRKISRLECFSGSGVSRRGQEGAPVGASQPRADAAGTRRSGRRILALNAPLLRGAAPEDQPGHDDERGDEHVDQDALLPGDPPGCARRRALELSCRCRESGAGGDAAS